MCENVNYFLSPSPPFSTSISLELQDLLLKLTEKDPLKRIAIPEIRKHPWFTATHRFIPSEDENCRCEIAVTDQDIKDAFHEFKTPIHILVSTYHSDLG